MKAEISLPKMMQRLTLDVTVTGVRRTKLRIWLGGKILILAAAVMGCNIEVRVEQ